MKFKLLPIVALLTLVFTLFIDPSIPRADQQNPIIALTVDPSKGTLIKATDHTLAQSRDGGGSWQSIALPLGFEQEESISSVVVSTGKLGNLYLSGKNKGVYQSTDNGKSWQTMMEGLPTGVVITLSAHATISETLYAIASEKTIYRSQNAGKSWQLMDQGPGKMSMMVHTNMEGSMQSGWLFAATPEGVQRAMDCFCMWRKAGELTGEITGLTYNPKAPKHVYAINDGQLVVSRDGGEIWEKLKSPTPELTALTFSASGYLYMASKEGQIYRSKDDAKTWVRVDA